SSPPSEYDNASSGLQRVPGPAASVFSNFLNQGFPISDLTSIQFILQIQDGEKAGRVVKRGKRYSVSYYGYSCYSYAIADGFISLEIRA
ncbi:MAG: hypothetical protein L0Y76_06830, partial [Ignavibacteria bacterium]|nr:hypothetical protein [Ignavibacteria bacterium]